MVAEMARWRVRLRVALSGSAAAILAGAFLAQLPDRDSIDATIFAFAALPAAPIPFLAERPRGFRIAAAAYAAVFVPYAFLFGLGGDGVLFPDELWVLWPPALLMACAATVGAGGRS